MARGQRSTATPIVQVQTQRRSTRNNRGCNGRDVQLDRLAEQLVAPARQKKRSFVPEEGLDLENNVLAPVPKKRRSKKARTAQPQLPPATQPPTQPCSSLAIQPSLPSSQPPPQLPPNDARYGFRSPAPTQQRTTRLVTRHPTLPSFNETFPSPHSQAPPPLPPLQRDPEPSDQEDEDEDEDEEDEDEEDETLNPDFQIDEQSEGEDDRQAHAFLRASPNQVTSSQPPVPQHFATPVPQRFATPVPQRFVTPVTPSLASDGHRGFANFGPEQSVLSNHHKRNRPPKAPVFHSPVPAAPPSPQSDSPSDDVNPRNVESYSSQWQEVFTKAKLSFRAYVGGKCGFPDGGDGFEEAVLILNDAAAGYIEEGGTLGPGYKVTRDMAMIVYNESCQLRSQLKADIRVQVRNLKSLFPDDRTRPPNGVQASIRDRVASMVLDDLYLHDTVPNSDEQIHFGHPIIASTCRSFYFDRWMDVSAIDRDTFRGSVPKTLVALVGAVYRNVLDEWSTGIRHTIKLDSKHYGKTYTAILDALETVDKDEYYGPLLRQRLAAWAGFGESTNGSSNASGGVPTICLNLRPPAR